MSEIKPTHKKRQLVADCVQWRSDNMPELQAWCDRHGFEPREHAGGWVILIGKIRACMWPMYWAVMQENGEVKTYDQSRFELIYEVME